VRNGQQHRHQNRKRELQDVLEEARRVHLLFATKGSMMSGMRLGDTGNGERDSYER